MKKQLDINPLAAIADEIFDLEAELAPFKAKTARLEALRKSVRAFYEQLAPSSSFEVRGARSLMLVGPNAAQRIVNCAVLFKLIGPKAFLKCCAVTLKAIEGGAAAGVFKQDVLLTAIETTETGPRSIKTFAAAALKVAA